MKTLNLVYFSLMVLLALTVGVSFFSLHGWGIVLSLVIAIAKAILILLFFMHLRSSSSSLRIVALAAGLWIFFLFSLTAADYMTRMSIGVLGK